MESSLSLQLKCLSMKLKSHLLSRKKKILKCQSTRVNLMWTQIQSSALNKKRHNLLWTRAQFNHSMTSMNRPYSSQRSTGSLSKRSGKPTESLHLSQVLKVSRALANLRSNSITKCSSHRTSKLTMMETLLPLSLDLKAYLSSASGHLDTNQILTSLRFRVRQSSDSNRISSLSKLIS